MGDFYMKEKWFSNNNSKAGLILFFTTIIALYFLIPGFFSTVAYHDNYDNHSSISLFYHCLISIRSLNFSNIYHYPIYFPYGYASSSGAIFLGQAIILTPLFLLGIENVYFLSNILIFIAFLSGGYSLYLLSLELSDDYRASLMAGMLYILLPVKRINYPHLNQIFFAPSILVILFLCRYLKNNKKPDLILFGAFYFIQSLFDISSFFILTFLLPFLVIGYFISIKKIDFLPLLKLAGASFFSGCLTMILFYPYITNPLGFEYVRDLFDKDLLIPSYSLFSSFAFGNRPFMPESYPLFLGVSGGFFLFYFFFTRTDSLCKKIFSSLLFPLMIISYLLVQFPVIDPLKVRYIADIALCLLLLFLISYLIIFFKTLRKGESFILISVIILLFSLFQGPYRFISLELNVFRILSYFIEFFGRMRGIRTHYFFFIFWILLISLGIKHFNADRKWKRILLSLLILMVLAENFPINHRYGTLKGFVPEKINSYRNIEKYPDYWGILELPHQNGGPREYINTLHTVFHNKQIYNGHFGEGIRDPLRIYRRGYFRGINTLSIDILDPYKINYLRERGIMILIVHKNHMISKPSHHYLWQRIVHSFSISYEKGYLQEYYLDDYCLIGILSEKREGKEFVYQLPYRYFRKRSKILFNINNNIVKNSILWTLNDDKVKEIVIDKGIISLEIDINKDLDLDYKENYLKIKSQGEIYIEYINVL